MAIADQSLARWAPKVKPSQGKTKISAQALREQNVHAQSTRKARSRTKIEKTLGVEISVSANSTDAQTKTLKRPERGEKKYCIYRRPIYLKSRNIVTEGRACSCTQHHAPIFAQEWRDSPAEADWDYDLPNRGYSKRYRKVAFAEESLNAIYEVDKWFKMEHIHSSKYWSSRPPGMPTDKSTPEEEDADVICQELKETFTGFALVNVETRSTKIEEKVDIIEDDCSWLTL